MLVCFVVVVSYLRILVGEGGVDGVVCLFFYVLQYTFEELAVS